MTNKKHTPIILLAFLMFQLAGVLQAKENADFTGSRFTVNKGASVEIGESASLTISNLITEADITGKGKLILLSNKNSFINANNHSIENLVLAVAGKTELLSGLQITNKLSILSGELHLNDFNLTIAPNTTLDQSTLEKIIQNGSGNILVPSIGIPYAAVPFVFSGTFHFDFSVFTAFAISNKQQATSTVFYYTLPFIPNRTTNVLVPPPKV